MNRIALAIDKTRATLASGQRLDGAGPIDPSAVARLDKSLDNGLDEWFAYQTAQSRAHAMGVLTTEEAQVIYRALGGEAPGPGGWAAGTDLATKVVVTKVLGELARIR